jgi:phospholipid transport system substrate-binding protein
MTISKGTLILAATLTFLAHAPFLTSARAAGPQDRVQQTLAAVSAVLRDPALQGADSQPERRRRVRNIIYESFHFDEMARESLGPQWKRLTSPQQEEFVRLFGNLFEGSYNRLVLRFLGDRQAIYDAESVEGNHAVVQTTLIGGKEERLSVEYQLASRHQRWGVVDVRLDGVSLAMNYRAQFNKILRKSSYDTLVQRMRSKVER